MKWPGHFSGNIMARKEILEAIREGTELRRTLSGQTDVIEDMIDIITAAIKSGKKILVFGNGGSAADAQHMVGELIGRFQMERRAISAIALNTNTSVITSIGNDYGFERIFERQIEGLAEKGDVCIGISTSGNSGNVISAIKKARQLGAKTLALTGGSGGELARISEKALVAPSHSTPRIQELHIAVIHIICQEIEKAIFGS